MESKREEDSYIGEKRKEIRHGFGTYVYKKGSFCVRYEGEWKDGEKHGKGKMFFSDGSVYSGDFREGEMTGYGTRKYTNRSYTGEFLLGEYHGEGIYTDKNVTYEGSFRRNKRDGTGKLTNRSNGTVYDGKFSAHRKHGYGVEISPDERYEGMYVRGVREGHGTLKNLVTNVRYEGNFSQGRRQGIGKQFDPKTNITYEGRFFENKQFFISTSAKCVEEVDTTIEIGHNLKVPNLSFKILGKCNGIEENEEEEKEQEEKNEEEEEEEEKDIGEVSALESSSSTERVYTSSTIFLMDVESGRRFLLEIGQLEGEQEEKKTFVSRPWLVSYNENGEKISTDQIERNSKSGVVSFQDICVDEKSRGKSLLIRIRSKLSLNDNTASWSFPVKVQEKEEEEEKDEEGMEEEKQ